MAWSNSHAGPENAEPQLFGAAPEPSAASPASSRGGRHQYQSRLGLSFEDRDSMNQGCSSEVWLTTRSMTSFMPRACSPSVSSRKSSSVPKIGSTLR